MKLQTMIEKENGGTDGVEETAAETAELLRTIRALTIQQEAIAHKILALKRRVAGRTVAGQVAIQVTQVTTGVATATDTETETDTATDRTIEKKRGRGRPKKNMILTSNLSQQQTQQQTAIAAAIANDRDIINNTDFGNKRYVIENNDLFIRSANGMLFDIDTLDVVGWYNPYAQTGTVEWLYT